MPWCVLSEPCGAAEVQSIIIITVGIVMVTKTPLLFNENSNWTTSTHDTTYYGLVGITLFSALMKAADFVLSRALKEVDFNIVVFWAEVIGFLPTAIASYILMEEVPTLFELSVISVNSLMSYLIQVLVVLSLQLQYAGLVSVTRCVLEIILSFILQATWYGQVPDTLAVLGASLISVTFVFEEARRRQ